METATAGPDLRPVQEKIVAKRFDEALDDLDRLLAKTPDDTEALYMSAVCCRYLQKFDQALEFIDRLKTLAPEHGRAHQEEGHAFRDMGRPDDALAAYSRACRFNPALKASWRSQLTILEAQGRERLAVQVRAQLERLEKLAPPLVAVTDLVAQGRLLKAEDLCRQYLKKVPHDVEGMRLLADIGSRLGVLDDAEFLLESAVKLAPDNIPIRVEYVRILRKRQKFARALEEAGKLLETAPETPQFQSLYAVECMQTGDYDTAIRMLDRVLERIPGDPVTLTSKGHAQKTLGDYAAAVDDYHAAIKSQPLWGEAWYSLANLKVYTFGDEEIARMRNLEQDRHLTHMDRVYLCFALGKALEDREQYEDAFRYYEKGNHLRKAQSRYDADDMAADLAAQQRACTAELFTARQGSGCDAPDPIFVVGLPRAGSTLIEQILSSHSQVDGTLELPNILALSQRLRRRGRSGDNASYPDILAELPADELEAFGREYIEDTRIHRQGAPFFVDKMPNNFRHIGLIHLILPNAKIIDARRHPMACCFSGFKQLFAEGQEFTYGLEEIGRYYRDYVDLMDHWDRVLPGRVLRVQYENVVADLETEVRRMLDYLGLPFEAACLSYHETDRSVRTPSSEQVRQPIYRTGLEQWRHFEPWLGPLEASLGPVLERYPIGETADGAA